MKACTIFSHFEDLEKVHDRLVEIYGPEAMTVSGPPDNWTRIELNIRKLFRKSKLTLNVLRYEGEDSQVADMTRKMYHVFQSIPAKNTDIQAKLLNKIRTIRLAIGVVAEKGLTGFEEAIFAIAKSLDGVVFWEGNQMLNKKGRLILDFKGNSRVEDLEVVASSELLDRHVRKSLSAEERKKRSEAYLEELNVPVNKNLPIITGDEEVEIRSLEEVADRALALCLVALKGEGLEQEIVERVMQQFEILDLLSPAERAFIENAEPGQQDRVTFTWRYESFWTMLWALGLVEELEYPHAICDVQHAVKLMHEAGDRAGFRAKCQLRGRGAILDEADKIYRLHWAIVDARLRGQPAPADLEPGVVYERHYALNWLRCYFDQAWDNIRTDT